jgi:hypothetical protein
MSKDVILIDKMVSFEDAVGTGSNDGLIIKHTQEIPQEHLDALRVAKADTIGTPMGEMHRVCSIPTNWVEEWQREGFDVMKESVQDIIKRLKQKQLDDFITTTKRI